MSRPSFAELDVCVSDMIEVVSTIESRVDAGELDPLESMRLLDLAERFDRRRREAEHTRDALRNERADLRDRVVESHLDRFEHASDEAIHAWGGVVRYSRHHRIVAITAAQAHTQYGRLRRALMENGITDEMAEWVARDLAYDFAELTKERG